MKHPKILKIVPEVVEPAAPGRFYSATSDQDLIRKINCFEDIREALPRTYTTIAHHDRADLSLSFSG